MTAPRKPRDPRAARSVRLLVLAAAAAATSGAFAQANDQWVFGQAATGDHRTRSVSAGFAESFRSKDAVAASTWDVYRQFEVSEWYASQNQGRKAFTQVGFTPVFRYTPFGGTKGVFVELGIGLNWIMPHYRSGDHQFSTSFNFGDHAGVGMRFGDAGQHEVSLRFEHFSNGGIKNPNPGIDFGQVRYAWHF